MTPGWGDQVAGGEGSRAAWDETVGTGPADEGPRGAWASLCKWNGAVEGSEQVGWEESNILGALIFGVMCRVDGSRGNQNFLR